MTPLREYKRSVYSDEIGRVCAGCGRYRLHEDYYRGKSRCKKCIIKANTETNRNRRDREYDPFEPRRAREIA